MRALLAALAALFLALPAQAQVWHEAETAHFIVKSRDSESETREFAQLMERFDRGLRFLMNLPEDHVEESRANKPVIYRFGDYIDMSRMYGQADAGIGGFFISRAGASVGFAPARRQRSNNSRERRDRTDSIEQVLLHEYTHYFMNMNFPAAYPRWYSEGYAEMVSTMRFADDGSFHIGDPPQSRGQVISSLPASRLTEMLDDTRQATGYDLFQHYVTGWLFSHYMSFDPAREAKLREFLVAVGNGEASLPAAERIFGDLNEIQRELVSYKNGPFPGYNVRPNITSEPVVAVRQLSDEEVAFIDAEMKLQVFPSKDDASTIARQVSAALATYPNSSHGHELLGYAELVAENYDAADAAAAQAVLLDPENQDAWLLRAAIALEMAENDPTRYELARGHLQTARTIDTEDPRPLILYYNSFYDELGGTNLPEHAIVALEQAYDEAGSDLWYRLTMGRQLLLEDRYREARIVMMPGLYSGHTYDAEEDDDFTPDRLFAAIDAQDRELALELVKQLLEPDDEDES